MQNPLNNLHKTREIKKFEDSDPMTITYELFSTCYKKYRIISKINTVLKVFKLALQIMWSTLHSFAKIL